MSQVKDQIFNVLKEIEFQIVEGTLANSSVEIMTFVKGILDNE